MNLNFKINYANIVEALKEDIRYILVLCGGCFLCAGLYCVFAPRIYSSDVLINPPKLSDAGSGLTPAVAGMFALAGVGQQRSNMDVTIGLLQTRQVADLVSSYIESDPKYKKLKKRIKFTVDFVPDQKSGFLDLVVNSTSPEFSRDVANYYVKALGKSISNVAISKAMQKANFYAQQIEVAKENQDRAESALLEFRRQYGMTAGVQADVSTSIITSLQGQLIAQQTLVDSMATYSTPDNPDYKAAKGQLDSIRQQIATVNDLKGGNNKDGIESYFAPVYTAKYDVLLNEYNLRSTIYLVLIKQFEANNLDVQNEMDPVALDVVDPPIVPNDYSKPKSIKILGLTIILSLMAGCVLVIIKNRKQIFKHV